MISNSILSNFTSTANFKENEFSWLLSVKVFTPRECQSDMIICEKALRINCKLLSAYL